MANGLGCDALVRHLLDGRWHSGAALVRELGITPALLRTRIRTLRSWGLEIQAARGAGYRLAQTLELFDEARIREHLALADPVAIHIFPALESTNEYLMSRPLDGGSHVCLAEFQRAGRGRRGRAWVSPFGANVCLSVGWSCERVPPDLAALGLALGLVSTQFLHGLGAEAVLVKWPNDLVVDGRKLAGILVEQRRESRGRIQIVAGIGLNLSLTAEQASQIGQPWTSLAQVLPDSANRPPSRNRIAAGLIDAILRARNTFHRQRFAPFRALWPRHDATRDRRVNVYMAGGTLEGIARGVDVDGALLLDTGQEELRRIVAGEVSLRVAAGVAG